MTLDADEARARAVLGRLGPGPDWMLRALARGPEGAVFRARPEQGPTVIIKLASGDGPRGRLAAQAARLAAVHPRLASGMIRVPAPLLRADDLGGLVLEDTRAPTLADLLAQADATRAAQAMARAGAWAARFHRLTGALRPFDPNPHMAWLDKGLARDDIAEIGRLKAHLPGLRALAEAARAAPALTCVTHGDFHARNIALRPRGMVFAFDFDNSRRDLASRDGLFLLMDLLARGTASAPALPALAEAFATGYGPSKTDPAVSRFFQRFMALSAWVHKIPAGPLGPARTAQLRGYQWLAEVPLVTPPAA